MSELASKRYQTLKLEIPQLGSSVLHVVSMTGEEAVSRPYAFRVHFTTSQVVNADDALGKPACLTLIAGGEELIVAGVIVEFEIADPKPNGDFLYCATLGPRFSLLDLSRQNQVYGTNQAVTIKDIIDGKLSHEWSRSSTSGGETIQLDYEIRFNGSYTPRNQVVQFEESDLKFISRSCEHYGVFYFFEHSNFKETLIFGDSNFAFSVSNPGSEAGSSSDGVNLPYRQTLGLTDDASIHSFISLSRPVPKKIFLRDFNDAQAGNELLASVEVDDTGIGVVVEYGDNFSSEDAGNELAKIRAEELKSEKTIFKGAGTSALIRPGYFFNLTDHPNNSMNGKYVVISASHHAGDMQSQDSPYTNSFECRKLDEPYRPRRVTPRPVAAGLYNATIDSADSGQRADIDHAGRYKIRNIYDESHSPPGQASDYVRKAQPYAGKDDTGLHFPLLKDTEVVIGYVNGDPDRPIILGAVPNSLTPAVSAQANQFVNRLRTASGSLFEINDGPGKK